MDPGPHTLQDDLVLKLSDDGKFVQAEFATSLDRQPIKLPWLQEQLNRLGLDRFRLNNDALDLLIQQYNSGTNSATINFGECIDGEFRIEISDDAMSATLNLSPAFGGLAVTEAMILAELERLQVTFGVIPEAIKKALETGDGDEILIAQGHPPQHGGDGYFDSLIAEAKDRRPRIDAKGIAHYFDISEFVTVKEHEPLVKRVPATTGSDGMNIKGQTVAANRGNEVMFAPSLPGTKIHDRDPNLLVAAIAGQPVIVEHGAIVEPTITVDNVDLNTGNIEFDGAVMVNGDVTTGLKVITSGDVIIKGMIEEAAYIEAGGDLIVHQGVIGRGSVTEDNGKPGKGIVKLKAGGSISAKFIENTCAYAERDIQVAELVVHSNLMAGQRITVGKKGAKRGHIMGGTCYADLSVQVQVLGSQGNGQIKVEVGSIKKYLHKITQLENFIQAKQNERSHIEKVFTNALNSFKKLDDTKAPEFLQKLQHTLDRLALEISQFKRQIKAHQETMARLKHAKIEVKKQIHAGVEMIICNNKRKFSNDHVGGTFIYHNSGKIEFLP
ncbi:DUF342 domain-containing protein [Kaarinaea lacus]